MSKKEIIIKKIDELKDELMDDADANLKRCLNTENPTDSLASYLAQVIPTTKGLIIEHVMLAEALRNILYLGSIQEQKRIHDRWSQETIDLIRELLVEVYVLGIKDAIRRENRHAQMNNQC
jgi:hypothetical protein